MPTARCYPKHTPNGGLPDNASLALYTHRWYNDGPEQAFGDVAGYAAFLLGWVIVDAVPTDETHPIPISGGYGYWWDSGVGYWARWDAYRVEIQWDFTPLPVSAVVTGSTLHIRTHTDFGYDPSIYFPYSARLGGIALPAQALGDTIVSDIDAGVAWVGGSEPWFAFESLILDDPANALGPRVGLSPWGAKSNYHEAHLGWGLFSLGECAYIDVTYTYPPTITSVVPNSGARGTA